MQDNLHHDNETNQRHPTADDRAESTPDDDRRTVARRDFLRTASALTAAGIVAPTVTTGSVSALLGNDPAPDDIAVFANPRVQEAMQAWERGYRGDPMRSIAMTDSGSDSRHPDIGPWNGLTASTEDGSFELVAMDHRDWEPNFRRLDSETFDGENLGAVAVGLVDTHDLSPAGDTDRLTGTLTWDDGGLVSDVEIRLLEDGNERTSARGTDGGPIEFEYDGFDEGSDYQLEIVVWEGVVEYEATAAYYAARGPVSAPWLRSDDPDPFALVEETGEPALVGWHNDHERYGGYTRPRDDNSHGTHVASIMAGSGRAATFDPDRTEIDAPRTVLVLGDTLSYEVDAAEGTGVFGCAYGSAIDIVIEAPDGRELATAAGVQGTSEESFEVHIAEAPTVHGDGEATYTVHIRALAGELLSVGDVDTVAVGAFKHPTETAGDALDTGDLSLHGGVAPGCSITSVTDLGVATRSVGEFAEDFVDAFNIRAVNMSWGYVGGLPLGAAGGALDDIPSYIRAIAEAGMLSVAAAGNDATPASGNGAPAVANEAISVVSTDRRDGIASYSSGGLGGIDDDSGEAYMKPDVTAPGGELTELDIAALTGEPEAEVTTQEPESGLADAELEPVVDPDELEGADLAPHTELDPAITGALDYEVELSSLVLDAFEDVDLLSETLLGNHESGDDGVEGDGRDGVRDFTGKGGTSMAAPSVAGQAGLVSQAMEHDAPEALSLPEPAETGYEDVLRLKQVILATASESALTAAPYHAAKAPVYRHGERDPYEGYGRVNIGASIDAVTVDLTETSTTGEVGLDVPRDERAVAGYVRVEEPGEAAASIAFSHYGGGNAGATMGDPHLDLFVYDAQQPDQLTGEPTIVARDAGVTGDADVSWSVSVDDLEDHGGERLFFVVAKLVNVPGLVNGFDAQVHFVLETDFDPTGLVVEGEGDTDSSVYTGGQTARNELGVEVRFPEGAEVLVRDHVPPGWDVDEAFGDVEATTPALTGGTHAYFGLEDTRGVYEALTHFSQASDDPEDTGQNTFGPIEVTTDTDDDGTLTDREWVAIAGTERDVTLVGQST